MDRPRVAIAVRVSSRHQQEQGFGHASQVRRLPELVGEQGWEIARRPSGVLAVYDEGHASTTARAGDELSLDSRPVMQELLAELEIVRPTYLVCREQDRLHRNTFEWELIQHHLVKAGVEGVVQWPRLEGSPQITGVSESKDRMIASIQAVLASQSKADMKAKLGTGRRERAEQGLPPGGLPAYGLSRPVPKGSFVVDEQRAPVYRQMVAWTREGHGSAWIAHRLTEQGVPTPSGGVVWAPVTVRIILESQAQLGMVRVRRGGVVSWVEAKDQPAIVSREEWEAARAVLAGRQRKAGWAKRRHPLAGLLRCSGCGRRLKANSVRIPRKGGGRYEYVRYSCRAYNPQCAVKYAINENVAIKELAEQIDERLASTAAWIEPAPAGNIGEVEQQIAELEAGLADAERKAKRAHTAWVDATDDMASIALEELHRRRETLKRLKGELEKARTGYAQAMTEPSEHVDIELLRASLAGWQDFSDVGKREVLERIIEYAVLLPAGRGRRLEIHWVTRPTLPDTENPAAGAQEGEPPN